MDKFANYLVPSYDSSSIDLIALHSPAEAPHIPIDPIPGGDPHKKNSYMIH